MPFSSLTECDRLCDRFGQGRPAAMPGIVGGYLMKHLKLKSFGLAMMLLLASFPAPVREAKGAEDAQLAFTVGSDPNSAYLITGNTINVRETAPSGFTPQGLQIAYGTGASTIPVTDNSGIWSSPSSGSNRTITAAADFNPKYDEIGADGNPIKVQETDSKEGTYSISGRYYALQAEGDVRETVNDRTTVSKVRSETKEAIMQYSTITIRCAEEETLTNPPKWEIVTEDPDGKGYLLPTGAFEQYKDNGNVNTVGNLSKDPSKPKELRLSLTKENKEIILALNVQKVYNHVAVKDPTDANLITGWKDDEGNTLVEGKHYTADAPEKQDNLIRKGTTFSIEFRMPSSNTLLLTVMTPQYAVERIEEQVAQCNGVLDQSFIRLASGNTLDYITENFELLTSVSQFNGEFSIEWKWEPENAADQDVVQPGRGNGTWQTARISPKEDDVKGKLVAYVKYRRPNGSLMDSATEKANLPAKDIVIRGLGLPAGVSQMRELQGTATTPKETVFGANNVGQVLPNNSAKVMDAFEGGIPSYNVNTKGPFEYYLQFNMGAKNGAARYAIVELSGDTDVVSLQSRQGSENYTDYTAGEQITNPLFGVNNNVDAGKVDFKIKAQPITSDAGQKTVTLTVKFFIPDRNGTPQESSNKYTIRLNVNDSTPSQDSSLKSLVIRDKEGTEIEFPFAPDQYSYTGINNTIHIPYKSKSIQFIATLNDARGATNRMSVMRQTVDGVPEEECAGQVNDTGAASGIELRNGTKSREFTFEKEEKIGIISRFVFTVPSQDPRTQFWSTYTLDIVRDPASEDNTLKSLGIYMRDDEEMKNNLLPNFDPNVTEYNLEIPYSTDWLRIRAEKNHERAEGPVIKPELQGNGFMDTDKQWLKDVRKLFEQSKDGIVDVTFTVKSEAGVEKVYTVHMRRADPKADATLKGLIVTDRNDQNLTYRPGFNVNTETYVLDIPYSIEEIKLNLSVNDENVNNIQVYSLKREPGNLILELKNNKGLKLDALSDPIKILPISDDAIRTQGYHPLFIVVTAEDERTQRIYELRVQRAQPNSDALLKSLTMQDQDAKPIKTLAFHPDEMEYVLNVPYETTQVNFTPTANNPGAKISIKEDGLLSSFISYDIESGATSKFFALKDPGEEKRFDIVVTAEDGKTSKTYTVRVVRELPSNDARLKALKVDNAIDFAPLFIASKNKYTATVAEGAQGVIITATANHPGATIRIDGNVVESGKPSDLIELLEIKQKVKIEVIAQDGVTRKIYVIEFTNQNLIEKTNNADLRRLEVNDGLMTPNFKSAVTEYEVTATEKTYSVDIVPKADDSLATIRVLNGTREIGDYNGNYSLALVDGENPITVEVTSPDKSVVKEYNITIFRNVEEKLKTLEPLEAEDIDYENSDNPILVKIEEYPRIGASVFNELKNYPEKSIIFQGNDYSLRFDADNLNTVIPQAEIYDFRMSFTSPDEDDIYAIIGEYEANDDIIDNVVMAYFTYHGSLPGPAAFRLSLGTKYGSRTLYWHYYNQERDRIDYYGTVKSNNKGNFGVVIDHFSTYLISPKHRLAGSEDKRGVVDELGMVLEEDYELIESGGKVNPNTGEEGGRS